PRQGRQTLGDIGMFLAQRFLANLQRASDELFAVGATAAQVVQEANIVQRLGVVRMVFTKCSAANRERRVEQRCGLGILAGPFVEPRQTVQRASVLGMFLSQRRGLDGKSLEVRLFGLREVAQLAV